MTILIGIIGEKNEQNRERDAPHFTSKLQKLDTSVRLYEKNYK